MSDTRYSTTRAARPAIMRVLKPTSAQMPLQRLARQASVVQDAFSMGVSFKFFPGSSGPSGFAGASFTASHASAAVFSGAGNAKASSANCSGVSGMTWPVAGSNVTRGLCAKVSIMPLSSDTKRANRARSPSITTFGVVVLPPKRNFNIASPESSTFTLVVIDYAAVQQKGRNDVSGPANRRPLGKRASKGQNGRNRGEADAHCHIQHQRGESTHRGAW